MSESTGPDCFERRASNLIPMRRNPYGFTVDSALAMDEAEAMVRRLLEAEGFEVVGEVDMRELRNYRILYASDPLTFRRAVEIEPAVGLVLPCHVVLDARPTGGTSISFLDPMVVLAMVGNPALRAIAADAWSRLNRIARQLTRRRAA